MTEAKHAAQDAASSLKQTVSAEAANVKQKAMSVIGDAQTKVADQTLTAANKLRDTADGLNGEMPWMKTALEKTAEGLERLNSAIGSGDVTDLIETTKDFARRQPALFLGLSVAAGFALARVGKTAMDAVRPRDAGQSADGLDTTYDTTTTGMQTPYSPGSGV
jgi:hypothetical protein